MAEVEAEAIENSRAIEKYFDDQFDDETVSFVFRKHPIVMRKGFVISMCAWLIGPLIVLALTYLHPNNPPTMTAFFGSLAGSILLGCILIVPSWISWYFSVFVVTDQRLIQITQKGFFTKSVVDIALPQIQMINYEVRGVQETLLGFGTIRVQTYVGELTIHDVHHPGKTAKKLQKLLKDQGINASSPLQ